MVLLCVPQQDCLTPQSSQPPIVSKNPLMGTFSCFLLQCTVTYFFWPQWSVKTKTSGRVAGKFRRRSALISFTCSSSRVELLSIQMKWLCFYGATNPCLAKKKIKRVIIHQVMNYICQCGNNCFNALLKTMGDCDLWSGRRTCSRTNISSQTCSCFVKGELTVFNIRIRLLKHRVVCRRRNSLVWLLFSLVLRKPGSIWSLSSVFN